MSPILDWTDVSEDGFALPSAGEHMAEVSSVDERTSRNGDAMLSIGLRDAVDGRHLCYDIAMLTGKGRPMGMAKLIQLGVAKGTKSFDPASLIGRKVRVWITHEEYEGRTQAKVDARAEGYKCGYLAVDQDPIPAADETPF